MQVKDLQGHTDIRIGSAGGASKREGGTTGEGHGQVKVLRGKSDG